MFSLFDCNLFCCVGAFHRQRVLLCVLLWWGGGVCVVLLLLPLVWVVLVAFHVASVARVRVLCGSVIGNSQMWSCGRVQLFVCCCGSVAVVVLLC